VLDNAVRHARTQVRVDVGGRALTIRDDGDGIPVAERERVFERFTRLDEARARDGGGSGLGLAIARELCRRNGGTITMSDAAPGLAVTLCFPAPPVESPQPV
jgi:signal transduction histidine kinase